MNLSDNTKLQYCGHMSLIMLEAQKAGVEFLGKSKARTEGAIVFCSKCDSLSEITMEGKYIKHHELKLRDVMRIF